MTESQITLYVLSSLLVIMIPGQDLLLVMSRGMTQGGKSGLVTAAGVSTGLLGHTVLAALGLGAVLSSSELLFTVLKTLGALYLAYLGLSLLFKPTSRLALESAARLPTRRLFVTGALSNLSNPKITIFYFAYLPQFIAPGQESPTLMLAMLGAGFALLTFIVKAPIGLFAGFASMWIRQRPAVIRALDRVSGTVLIGLGVKLAFEQR